MERSWFDPITERWIKPRPEREPEPTPCMSMGEALLAAVEAKAMEERNARIWEYLRQSAEGVNSVPVEAPAAPIVAGAPAEYEPDPAPGYILYGIDFARTSEPEYEAVESLGYVYWRKKETA